MLKTIEFFFWVKNAIWVTLKLFLASISVNFKLEFCTLALKYEWNHCQNRLPHNESVQLSYWRSWLNDFEGFWPKTSILCFENWIIWRVYKTLIQKIAYHRLYCSTICIFQQSFGSNCHKTQSSSSLFPVVKITTASVSSAIFTWNWAKNIEKLVYFSVALPV